MTALGRWYACRAQGVEVSRDCGNQRPGPGMLVMQMQMQMQCYERRKEFATRTRRFNRARESWQGPRICRAEPTFSAVMHSASVI